jgi:hypothetical protein
MPPRIAKLAGMGAFGAIVFFVALFGYIFWVSAPRAHGGIDSISAIVVWIALTIVLLGLIAVHVVLGRGLLALSRGVPTDL